MLLPATAAGGDAAAAALRPPGAPDRRRGAAHALGGWRARADGGLLARAARDAPTLGPPTGDAGALGALDELEALVDTVRAARAAAQTLEVGTLHRDGDGNARVVFPAGAAASSAPGDVMGVSRVQARRLEAAATARSLIPPPGRSYATAAALLARAALLDVVDPSRRNARGLLEAALDLCDVVVEAARRSVVVTIYDGDGTRYGGDESHDTSCFIDTLRSFYDKEASEKRDTIEDEAQELQALRLADFARCGSANEERVEWVAARFRIGPGFRRRGGPGAGVVFPGIWRDDVFSREPSRATSRC